MKFIEAEEKRQEIPRSGVHPGIPQNAWTRFCFFDRSISFLCDTTSAEETKWATRWTPEYSANHQGSRRAELVDSINRRSLTLGQITCTKEFR
jgi:hypothetical protein